METQTRSARVKLAGNTGLYGTIDATALEAAGGQSVTVHMDDGRTVMVPRDTLFKMDERTYELRLTTAALDQIAQRGDAALRERVVIPLVAETLSVGKREVETGRVRVTKVVKEHEELVDQLLRKEEVTVERVPVSRAVDGPVAVREEGDTIIIPLVEEVLVVEKRLMLREELRITRRASEVRESKRVNLRSEDIEVERISSGDKKSNGTGVA